MVPGLCSQESVGYACLQVMSEDPAKPSPSPGSPWTEHVHGRDVGFTLISRGSGILGLPRLLGLLSH